MPHEPVAGLEKRHAQSRAWELGPVPLILATGAPTASGHAYDDLVGVQHAFPRRYRRQMIPGTPFVYYRGRRGASLGLPGPAYFGTGILGSVHQTDEPVLVAEILDSVEFEAPVPIKDVSGAYFETRAVGNPSYWRRGVRSVDENVVASILAEAVALSASPDNDAAPDHAATRDHDGMNPKLHPTAGMPTTSVNYAKRKAELVAVERYAVDTAMEALRSQYGEDSVREMPPNNPGYDVLVSTPDGLMHVEVKGTRRAQAVFFMSEGERVHSHSNVRYLLCVVSAIDLAAATHTVRWHRGAVESPSVQLTPRQWQAVLSE